MKALILGAGYGVRLYPLTKNTPKPLLNIAGKAVIDWLLEQLTAIKDIDEIFIVSNQRFYQNYERWLEESMRGFLKRAKAKISLYNDGSLSAEDKLGAIGDIQFVIDKAAIKDDLLVIAGDNLFKTHIKNIIKHFKTKGTTIGLKEMKDVDKKLISQYSVVTLDKDNRVIDFEEKPPNPKTNLIAVCLYVFRKEDLGLIKEYINSGMNADAPGYYIQWLCKRNPVSGYIMKEEWFDIGDIDSYNAANNYYQKSQYVLKDNRPYYL
ncbi:MAG: nucleotidyltransferase family protein [Planctomycetes bacterium]|nr:nucleotidyltransferase family protein [Planctomycetota bacterium]